MLCEQIARLRREKSAPGDFEKNNDAFESMKANYDLLLEKFELYRRRNEELERVSSD
jgi:hypothetical protein